MEELLWAHRLCENPAAVQICAAAGKLFGQGRNANINAFLPPIVNNQKTGWLSEDNK